MGKTFSYSEQGPRGLAGDKRIILAIARGGFYGSDTPMSSFEHAETYLRSVFSLLGVSKIEVIAAEGIARGPESRAVALQNAHVQIAQLQPA